MKRIKRIVGSFVISLLMAVTMLPSFGTVTAVHADGENKLTVKWTQNGTWDKNGWGSGDSSNYTFTNLPSSNGDTIQAEVDVVSSTSYEIGTYSFSIPTQLVGYRDGKSGATITGYGAEAELTQEQIDAGATYGANTYFSYKVNEDGTVTFKNVHVIPSNEIKIFTYTYTVNYNAIASGTAASVTPTGAPAGVEVSGATLTFNAARSIADAAKISLNDGHGIRVLNASAVASGKYFGHDASYYAEDGAGSFKKNFYMLYRLRNYNVGNESRYVDFKDTITTVTDELDPTLETAGKDGKIVGMSTDADGVKYAKAIDGTTGTYRVGEVDADGAAVADVSPVSAGDYYCYVLVSYPRKSNSIEEGQSVIGSDEYVASITGSDTNVTVKSDPVNATGKWTLYALEQGGGDGSSKTNLAYQDTIAGAAALLHNNKDVTVSGYNVLLDNWYSEEDADKKYVAAKHTAVMVDDTLMAYSSTYGKYYRLGVGDYSLSGLTIKDLTESTYDSEMHTQIAKTKSDATFKIYGSTALSGDSWTQIATRTFDEIKNNTGNGQGITELTGSEGYVRFKVEYGDSDYRSTFSAYPTWTLNGSSSCWSKLVSNDYTTINLSNSAAFLALDGSGKLIKSEDDTNYANDQNSAKYSKNYQNDWNGDGAADGQMNEVLSKDNETFAKYYSADRKGQGVPRSYCYKGLGAVEGRNTVSLTNGNTSNDIAGQQVYVPFTLTGGEYYTATGDNLKTMLESIDNFGIARDSATFYHLLPQGETLVENDEKHPITAQGTTSGIEADVKYKFINNYQGTGRTMIVFTVTSKAGAGNNTYIPNTGASSSGSIVDGSYLQSGFKVNYTTAVGWDSMTDVSSVNQGAAYMIDGKSLLGTAYPDQVDCGKQGATTSGNVNMAGVSDVYTNNDTSSTPAFNNLAGVADFDASKSDAAIKDTVYANRQVAVTADYAATAGLTKQVVSTSGTQPGIFSSDTDVEVGTNYSYRLTYNNSAFIKTTDMILYDNLETLGQWKGTFVNVDTTLAEARGIAPKIYYSTDSDATMDVTNESWKLWKSLQEVTDGGTTSWKYVVENDVNPSDIKSIAIDLSTTKTGSKFQLMKLSKISASLTFQAPQSEELDDAVNTAENKSGSNKAENYAGVSLRYYSDTTGTEGEATTISDKKFKTTVDLLDNRASVDISKTDEATKAALLGGAQFKLEAKLDDGSWVNTPSTPETGDIASCQNTDDAVSGVEVGDLVFKNTDYQPSSAVKETPLKLYPAGWIYSQTGTSTVKYSGVYRLTETKAPDGYVMNTDPSYIKVTSDTAESGSVIIPLQETSVKMYTDEGLTKETSTVDKNNADSNYRFENQTPDITVDKKIVKNADGTDAVDFKNGTVTYALTVINNGDSSVTGYSFKDVASNLTYVSHTPEFTAATETAAASGVSYTDGMFKIADELKPGKDNAVTINATYSINNIQAGIANRTAVSGRTLDKTRVASATDMTPADNGVYKEETVYYLITAGNTGETDLNEVITDTPSAGLELVRGTTESGNTVKNSDGTITWTTGTIAAGNKATMLVEAVVTGTASTETDGKTELTDVNEVTNTATDTKNTAVATDPVAKISLAKTTDAESANVGDKVDFTITLTNKDNVNVKNYQFNENPDGLTQVSYSSDDAKVSFDKETGTFTVDSIGAAASAEEPTIIKVKITYTVDKTPFENNAGITPVTGDDISLTKVRVNSTKDLTPAEGAVLPGQSIVYQITVKNNGMSSSAYARTFTDKSSSNLTLSAVQTEDGDAVLNDDGTITWNAPEIGIGKSVTMLVTAKVNSDAKGTTVNTVYDDMHSSVAVDTIASLEITKEVDKTSVTVGDSVTYTVNVKNTSDADVKGVFVSDKLDRTVKYVSSNPESDYHDGQLYAWKIDVNAGKSATIKVTVKTTAVGTLKNTAVINPSDPGNENKPDTDTVVDEASSKDVKISAVVPNTGDSSNMYLWIALMVLACAGIASVTVLRKKSN